MTGNFEISTLILYNCILESGLTIQQNLLEIGL